MSVIPLRKAEEAVAEVVAAAESQRGEARGRADSVTQVLAEPDGLPFAGGALGNGLSRAGETAASAGKRTAEILGRPVIHLAAPAVSAVWAQHKAAASHWNVPLVSWVRLWLWGAPHTGVTGAAYGLLWVTASPAGAGALWFSYWACHAWALPSLPWF